MNIKWSYKAQEEKYQRDWNHTLLLSINNLTRHIAKFPIIIKVPSKFKDIIETLIFYKNGVICDKYKVEFIEEDINIIKVLEHELEIINF